MDDNKTNEQKAAAAPAGIKKAKERLKKDFPVVDNQYPEAIFPGARCQRSPSQLSRRPSSQSISRVDSTRSHHVD